MRELSRETACHEDCLPVARDAESRELAEHGRKCLRPRIELCSRDRERRGLDDDGDAAAFRDDVRQRASVEREAQRVADGRCHIDDVGRRRWWSEDDVAVCERDVDDARAGQERNTAHVAIQAAPAPVELRAPRAARGPN